VENLGLKEGLAEFKEQFNKVRCSGIIWWYLFMNLPFFGGETSDASDAIEYATEYAQYRFIPTLEYSSRL
jgi:hypothetical protein